MIRPSGATSTIHGCEKCLARIYVTNDRNPGFGSLRCGTLHDNAKLEIHAHFWVASKQPWIVLPVEPKTHQTQPDTSQGGVAFLTGAD